MRVRGKFGILTATMIGAAMLAPAVFTFAQEATPSVVINEVAWAGSSVKSSDEWIELKNISGEEMDFAEWTVFVDNPGNDYTVIIPRNLGTVPNNGFFLLSKFNSNSIDSALNIKPNLSLDFISFGITNSSFEITLSNPAGEEVDRAWDKTIGPQFGYKNSSGSATMERREPVAKGSMVDSWQQSTDSKNFDDLGSGIKNYGTPGTENSKLVEPPTIESISPNTAEVDETLHVESIIGTNFSVDPPPIVQLKLNGREVTADNIHVANSVLIDNCQFSLVNAEAGKWDLVIINPNGVTATLPQAVEVTEPPPKYDLTTTVRINEVYPQPNTTSNDEFIELYNFGDKVVDLNGWILDDVRNGGSNKFVWGSRNILPKSYLTLYKSENKLTMNDSGDDVYLLQPNGFELDHTVYSEAPRGQTWSRFDDGWKWTNSPTPNGKNVFSTPPTEEDESTPIDEPDDTPVANPTFEKGDVVISELLPNPVEDDEFIELYNNSSGPIDLKNWVLQDKSKHKYKVSDFAISIQTASTLTVQAGQYVVITEKMSGIALNNSGGETVTLYDPSGNVVATVSYIDKAPSGAAYAWEDGIWTWTKTPTPGDVNILGLDEADESPPEVDILMPDSLPVTGKQNQRWLGFGLISLGLSAIVFWNYAKRRYPQSS